jgi:hypothetical protein
MRRFLFSVLLLFPVALYSQHTITGVVLDSLTQEPMPSATVYVNGTTLGTVTDNDGRFELNSVSFPATVVFSFVGYQPQAVDMTRNPGTLIIRLKTNDELPEVVVSGKDHKIDKRDLDFFRKMFLGDDRWGRRAIIKNENVLMFDHSFDTSYAIRNIGKFSYVSANALHGSAGKREIQSDTVKVISSVFRAWAYEPLIIEMPLLGYELYVDLIEFSVAKTNDVVSCDMLGYFYYRPYVMKNKWKALAIEENRKKAYYGSNQHFLRSFADDRLAENGYMLSMPDKVVKGRRVLSTYLPVDIGKYSADSEHNTKQIHDLKDRKLRIRYYQKNDGSPLNFRDDKKGMRRYSESWITILKDTCTFSRNGIVTNNDIQFTGDMSKKRVGSYLPDDYFPPEDSCIINSESVDYAGEMMKFVRNIDQFNSMFPQEKVYLEFDNTAYFQGENIWFKAFVTHATTLERAPSGVLYVDFLAPTGQLILQQKLKIEAGQADGAIPLLDAGTFQTREKYGIRAYPSGFYEIRAYTQNMLDFSPEAIFSRVIPVYTQPKFEGEYDRSYVESNEDNPHVNKFRGVSNQKYEDVNIKFYPEGGDPISGIPCRVAFKVTGSDAFGIDGVLSVPALSDSVYTVHDGMGSFIITPKEYNEMMFFPSGSNEGVKCKLFVPFGSGYSMITDMISDSKMQVNIWRTEDHIGERTALAVTCRGEVVYFREIDDVENSQLEIDCSDWPVGVCRVTLFDTDGMIFSSRSIFHNSKVVCPPVITINTDSMSRQSCDKEVIEFELIDQNGNPFRDRFCLSIRDATDYGVGRTDNLQTNLLLSSDLRGYIHDPAWYLETDDELHRESLNLLTMVQGWERYEWQTMTGLQDFNEKHRIEEGLTMNGWILSFGRRRPVSDINVYATLMPEKDKTLFESFEYHTDSTGYFGFDLTDFYGKGKFNINLMSTNNRGKTDNEHSKRIRFERADRPAPRKYYIQETDLTHNDHRVYDYKVDYSDFDLTSAQRSKLGRMIDDVDIEEENGKRKYIDYDTFISYEAEEDVELELDQGEYTSDLYQYFLSKGIRLFDPTSVVPFFYIHNSSRVLEYKPFDIPLQIDMIDVKSILLYDERMKDIHPSVEDAPILEEWRRKHAGEYPMNTILNLYHGRPVGGSAGESVDVSDDEDRLGRTLVDVLIKEDRELLFYWEMRNLSRRTTTVKGFTRPVQFYSPQYPEGPIEGSPDYRRTLYWNPNVITDEDGHARVEFYNNSFTRKFTIKAAGITASGVPYVLDQNW